LASRAGAWSIDVSVADYEAVIGLEVHCQLGTATKMFSPCAFRFGAEPNSLVDPYTLGLPGTLPVPNRDAVRAALAFGLAVGSRIARSSRFARKHYFYPDLPKGYQITQSDHPYAAGGRVEIPGQTCDRAGRTIRLIRVHLEEDAGKNTHAHGQDVSLVDHNRAGAPLLEIVSEPDIRSAAEAAAYMRELRAIVRALDISDANMEEGTLRCDANVSLRPRGTEGLGTRCEIKNLNSFRFLEAAIEAEIARQTEILDLGDRVVQATMTYDPERNVTRMMRTKEEAADYRYFPEPDLPPLVIPESWIEEVQANMPELPGARRIRYREHGLSDDDIALLVDDVELACFFDDVVAAGAPPKKACSWLVVELLGRLHADHTELAKSPVRPEHVAELVALVEGGTLSGRSAKEVFAKCYAEGLSPREIVERDGYRQVSDSTELERIIAEVIRDGHTQLEQYRRGKLKLRGWFVGQVMKRTGGQANPGLVQKLLDGVLPAPEDE
jgi:aspartyl-tRNA(Asn)/glutamyl-tRNA(Gln) amidotransferase subunit B